MLAEFAERQAIPYPLLSDVDSAVIQRYGILNDQVDRGDFVVYGIPYPGVYVTDEAGTVVAKFFHDTYKKRDSPERLIDAALGRSGSDASAEPDAEAASAPAGDDEVRVTAHVHGGGGTIRQGIVRDLVVRFAVPEGFHVYGEPVPEGMVPVSVELRGPPGLVAEEPCYPPTETLEIASMGMALPVWSGTVDVVVPFYADSELASETRPLDASHATLEVSVRYQACSDALCHPPRRETLSLEVPLDVIDVPRLGMHTGHGQREAGYDNTPHMRNLIRRKFRETPSALPRFLWRTLRLELAARMRGWRS